jgi:hypothetical protein
MNSSSTMPRWHEMRTEDSRRVEGTLRPEFPRTDAYRYNSASIRVRVIDPRFEGLTNEDRYDLVEPWLDRLPEPILGDIMNLLMLTPEEAGPGQFSRHALSNLEFEDPSPSLL